MEDLPDPPAPMRTARHQLKKKEQSRLSNVFKNIK